MLYILFLLRICFIGFLWHPGVDFVTAINRAIYSLNSRYYVGHFVSVLHNSNNLIEEQSERVNKSVVKPNRRDAIFLEVEYLQLLLYQKKCSYLLEFIAIKASMNQFKTKKQDATCHQVLCNNEYVSLNFSRLLECIVETRRNHLGTVFMKKVPHSFKRAHYKLITTDNTVFFSLPLYFAHYGSLTDPAHGPMNS